MVEVRSRRFSQRLDNLAPKLDVLQVIHLSKAWDSIPSATIFHCWQQVGIVGAMDRELVRKFNLMIFKWQLQFQLPVCLHWMRIYITTELQFWIQVLIQLLICGSHLMKMMIKTQQFGSQAAD